MSKKWLIVFTMAAMAAMLVGAGSGFAVNTYYWNGTVNGIINNVLNWDDISGAGGASPGAFLEGDVLVFDNTVGGALNLGTDADFIVGVTLTLDATRDGAVTITPANIILLSGIDMANSAYPLNIADGGTVKLSANANFITGAGGALTFVEALDNNTHTLTISGNGTPLFQGGMSGSGGLIITMAGAQAVTFNTNPATYTGNTTINKGNLTSGVANMLTNSGTYTLANDLQATITTLAIETIGSLAGGGNLGGNVIMGAALDLDQAENTTYSGIISGSGPLRKIGTGTLKLASANTYTAATTVDEGTLLINAVQDGACTGPVNVSNPGTILGGTGTTRGAVTINTGAIVKPGDDDNVPATLTATNAFTFTAGSTLIIDIVNTTSDLLAVSGALTVATGGGGAEIDLGVVPSSQAIQYTVVNAGSGAALFQTTNLNAGWSQSTNGSTFIKLLGVLSGGGISVPTLNEWGIIIMFLLLTGTGILVMRKRQHTSGIAR